MKRKVIVKDGKLQFVFTHSYSEVEDKDIQQKVADIVFASKGQAKKC